MQQYNIILCCWLISSFLLETIIAFSIMCAF